MPGKSVLTLVAAAAFFSGAATAADFERPSAAPVADYVQPPQAVNWSGLYLGVHGGYGFSAFRDAGQSLIGDASGGLIGFTGGYNFMATPQILLGVEADFAFAGIEATNAPAFWMAARGQADHLLTVRGRAGYAIDSLLLYASGGFAGGSNTISVASFFPRFWGNQSIFQTGWALGGGLEYMFMPRLSAKAEYMFTSVGSDSYFDFSPAALSSGLNTSAIKAGVNYHF